MIVKPKESDSNGAFEGSDSLHKNDLIKFVSNYHEIFQEPRGLHSIQKKGFRFEVYEPWRGFAKKYGDKARKWC